MDLRNFLPVLILLMTPLYTLPARAGVVSHTFSGRAFADPTLTSGVVDPDAAAFFADQGLDGAWFAASLSFDDAILDSDPTVESAEYRDAVIDSDLFFGPLAHEATTFCNGAFLDCSIFVDDDLPQFGGLFDEYFLRARNHRVLGVPQVLIPGTTVLIDQFIVNASFSMRAADFRLGSAPTLLDSTTIDPDLEALFGGGAHDIVITYFGTGESGSYSFGYRVETPFFVPEPTGSVWVMMGFFAWVAQRRFARRDGFDDRSS